MSRDYQGLLGMARQRRFSFNTGCLPDNAGLPETSEIIHDNGNNLEFRAVQHDF